ncbi:outer membrane lipoprotein-sorting protein [Methylophaga frappieri]|uniref:Outer membrane lipoprotein-sorting protein n=2 Tax=Methylophaga frappieri (strain ATCC BAA-2434 / DSM 25690 / JAM7) TaxID=754477 RepID=I1YF61_METFJ|nr:outer membrane lipoprotein-sorting protein [Methylophaga frappieri]
MKSLFFSLCCFIYMTPAAIAAELTGRDIAQRSDQADSAADSFRHAIMVIERGNQKLVRKMRMWEKKYGDDDRTLFRFDEPSDVRDTQYLSWNYNAVDQEDDLWLYLPTENLVRRISGGGKKGAFMRSDFANEDIEKRAVDDDVHTLLGSEHCHDGRACYLLESVPIPAKARFSNYAKRKIWIDKQHWLAHKVEYYDKRGRLLKTMIQGDIQEIDGVWTATKLIMQTHGKASRTLMQYQDIEYNQGLDDSLFQQSALKR